MIVTALLQFIACNVLHSVWWALKITTRLQARYEAQTVRMATDYE